MKSSGLSCSIWRFTAISMVAALALVLSMAAVIIPANPAQALNIEVTNTNDSGDGSLRKAIADSAIGGTINFSDTVTGAINLASQLTINKSLTITGPGEAILAISGNNTSRVFYVDNLGVCIVSISGMTIRNGNVTGIGDGGGIYNNFGNVTMTSCTVSGNEADDGGGIFNYGGQVTMTNCTVSDNNARDGNGGGISTVMPDLTLTLTNCTISGNNASGHGGGIYNNEDEVTLTNCTVSGNTAGGEGGGIYNNGELTMTNCTVSNNTAEGVTSGGGIYNDGGNVTMINCTVSGNEAQYGGGVYNLEEGIVTMTCTIVYDNTAVAGGDDGDDVFNAGTYTATESIVGNAYGYPDGDPDPLLDPLQDNGGPTETHALLAGSPAIDGCTGGNCTVDTDQRGITRPQLIACDVGAYEYQQPPPVGGIVEPVDRLSLLAPWLGLAAMMAVAITIAVVVRRRMA